MFGPDAPAPLVEVGRVVDELDLDAQPAEAVLEQPARARVDALRREDVVARLDQPEQRDGERRLAAADRDGLAAVLERGDPALQGGGRRVARAAVRVARLVAPEPAFGLGEAVELEPCGQVDGRDAGAVGGVAGLSRVDLRCAELRHPPMVRYRSAGRRSVVLADKPTSSRTRLLLRHYANSAFA